MAPERQPGPVLKILLLSAYDAASHRRWHQLLQRTFADCDWTVLALPPRYFSWRLRGNSLSWAFGCREQLQRDYDLVIATSMVDLSALRGFVPSLAQIPTLVYFHENQFAYPAGERQLATIEPQLLNLYTALAADRVVFNSDYNRRTLLQGARSMLAKFPDEVPAGLLERVESRSEVIPVPLEPECFAPHAPGTGAALEIVWNHRWEYDKGPDRLLAILRQLARTPGLSPAPVTLHIVGQQFRSAPAEFAQIRELIRDSASLREGHWGYIEDPGAYRSLLAAADVVLSTAIHDFQGLSVLEAVAAGCLPLLPDRLCYREWFGEEWLYPSRPDDREAEARAAAERLCRLQVAKSAGLPEAPDVSRFHIEQLSRPYRRLFRELVESKAHGQVAGE